MKASKKLFLSGCFFLIAAALSLCLGVADLSTALSGPIFRYVRLPRTCACLLSGAALAVAGCVIQAVLANRLASPGIIGVNAGAGLAVTVCCALGALSGWAISGAAFLGALAAVLLVAGVSQKMGASRTTVILCGVAVNSFLGALSDAVINLIPDAAVLSADFRVGTFASVSIPRLVPAGVLILAGLAVIFTLHNELDVLALGEETAQGLGMNVRAMRLAFLILSALLAGASVSFAGLLGFLGLIVPHGVRRIVGNQSKYLLPMSALWGGGFAAVCDTAARMVFRPYELPVGIFLSLLGGPFFLWLLYRRKGGKIHD